MVCSIYNLINITVSQYLDIVHPTSRLTSWWKKHRVTVIAWPWIFGLGCFGYISIPHTGIAFNICLPISFWPDKLTYTISLAVFFVIQNIIPVAVIVYSFVRMTSRLNKKNNSTGQVNKSYNFKQTFQ